MTLAAIRKQRRLVEAQLKRLYALEQNLIVSASMPSPLRHDIHWFTSGAKQRAMMLFWRHLTPEQRSEFTRQRWFTARGGNSGDTYRISAMRVARERRYDGRLILYCLVIKDERTPMEDTMLAKKIIIEKDESLFLNTAVNQGVHDADKWDNFNRGLI